MHTDDPCKGHLQANDKHIRPQLESWPHSAASIDWRQPV